MKNGHAIVRVWVDGARGLELDLVDLARRQCDHLGPYGFRAKKYQTNRTYRRCGYLRLRFPTRQLARASVRRLRRLHDPEITWRLMHNSNRYR
jgi:hypothetical protein